ncbi:FAD-binding oxidoreductase [Pontibacter sp. SGAir0037]|uniref:NAD(P)/FAD-dependent oxidoreductase n=1 Tax=Pontibacter sp. SGAir0037 TaxID=2571030 RepID=UPI0010CD062F|nr:FAD-dependent oxidoreductase [Pontibacter sp. SGAir0037]QCR22289.1 amino acid dehydrogenase [Pontibacter sp. SGAir0037]
MSKVTIIGGGIIGLFTAYYLSEEGFDVTVLDKGNLTNSCSIGNAGMIVPSHIVPLASPGIIGKGLKWMLSSTSPFYIHPRLDRRLVQWCLLFYKSATKKHVEYSIPYLKNLSFYSKSLYLQLAEQHKGADLGLEEKGLLMLYKTEEAAHEEIEFAELANHHGVEAQVLSKEEVHQLEPYAGMDVLGGVFFPGDAHLHPSKLNDFLIRELEGKGVKIVREATVLDFDISGKKVEAVITDKGDYSSDYVVIAAGTWSGEVAQKLKITMPMLGGKGYSFMVNNTPAIQRPAILTEARVAVTPFGNQVRFGGTMEITNDNDKINLNRVKGIHNAASKYYGNFQCDFPQKQDVWSGLRPCSPDGLPYIGFTERWSNVLFGTGHSMMGISLAPATGKLLTELLMNRKAQVQLDAFSPDRYS